MSALQRMLEEERLAKERSAPVPPAPNWIHLFMRAQKKPIQNSKPLTNQWKTPVFPFLQFSSHAFSPSI